MTKFLIVALFVPYVAFAQSLPTGDSSMQEAPEVAPPTVSKATPSGSPSAKNKKNQTVDFEDELIQGEVNKPELLYLLQQKQFNFKRLIKLREDFLPEMRRTSEEIKRGGGSN